MVGVLIFATTSLKMDGRAGKLGGFVPPDVVTRSDGPQVLQTHVWVHLQGPKWLHMTWSVTSNCDWTLCVSPPASNPCGENNGGCEQVCVLSHRTDNDGLGYRCKCSFGFELDRDERHCVGKKSVLVGPSGRQHRIARQLLLCTGPGRCLTSSLQKKLSLAHRTASLVGTIFSVHRAVFEDAKFCLSFNSSSRIFLVFLSSLFSEIFISSY